MNYITYSGTYSEERINFHQHKNYEIFIYSSGKGRTNIGGQILDVQQGMIVVMPPNTIHGSISDDNLSYVAISGKSDELMHIKTPIIFKDNERGDGFCLLQMIFANRYSDQEYFDSLCLAFIHFVLRNIKVTNPVEKAVNKIKSQMSAKFHDSELNVTELLNQSGYAEDYIRANFRKLVGKTPVEFLTELRIKHAKTLIKIYQNSTPLIEISLNCGFDDYVYFSRKFKKVVGISPNAYKKTILAENKE